jgi:2-oxoisovalerate dehydrogenase E1 component subunit alpha
VLACYAVTRKAMRAARAGEGPTLIEAFTYRMGAHTTTDDPTRYRLASELEAWRLRDPIERVRTYLARTREADAAFFEQVEAEADELAAELRAACLALPDPPPLSLFDHVYANAGSGTGSAILDAEREQYAAYLAGFAEDAEEFSAEGAE